MFSLYITVLAVLLLQLGKLVGVGLVRAVFDYLGHEFADHLLLVVQEELAGHLEGFGGYEASGDLEQAVIVFLEEVIGLGEEGAVDAEEDVGFHVALEDYLDVILLDVEDVLG